MRRPASIIARANRVAREEADQAARERAGFGDAWRKYVRDHEQDQPAALSRRLESAKAALYGAQDESLEQRTESAREALYGAPRKGKGA